MGSTCSELNVLIKAELIRPFENPAALLRRVLGLSLPQILVSFGVRGL